MKYARRKYRIKAVEYNGKLTPEILEAISKIPDLERVETIDGSGNVELKTTEGCDHYLCTHDVIVTENGFSYIFGKNGFNVNFEIYKEGVIRRKDSSEGLIPFTIFNGDITRDLMELAMSCSTVKLLIIQVLPHAEHPVLILNRNHIDRPMYYRGYYLYVENNNLEGLSRHTFLEKFEILEEEN